MSGGAASAPGRPTRVDRLVMTARVLLAVFGSYAVAALASAWLALVLPGRRAEAVSTATLVSFAIMAAAAIWVFAAQTLRRAALVLCLIASALTLALWLAGAFQGGGVR